MRKINNRFILVLSLFFTNFYTISIYGQCSLGSSAGIGVANTGTVWATLANFTPGTYLDWPVLAGGSYGIQTCGAPINTQLTGFDPSISVYFYNDDNGPICAGTAASADNIIPNFTNYMHVQVSQSNCLPGGTSSINVSLRQNNNLAFTSSSTDLCSGATRNLSATPSSVGASPGGYGNPGSFSGVGVVGDVFTAPVVAVPTIYTITYTFGYVSQTQSITVNPIPTIGSTATASVICFGQSTTLNGTGANTYTWSGGITNGLAFAPGATTIYSVTGTSAAGCVSTVPGTIAITVNPLPVVGSTTTNSVICLGQTTSLNGTGANTYTWSGGVTDAVAFNPGGAGIYSYTVNGTDAAGCTSTNSAVSSITVNALPTVTANSTATFICLNDNITLTGSGATTYTWTGGAVDGVPFAPLSTTSYSVSGTNGAGCTSTNVAAITVTVNALPTVTANATSTFICVNTYITLSGSGANTYTWTGGVTDGIAFATLSPNITSYSVSGTSTAGCISSNVGVVTVTAIALPTVVANASNPFICTNSTVALTGSGASTYTWSGGIANGVAFSPTATASYTVTGTGASACTNTDVVTVTVIALPTVTANATASVICLNSNITLTGSGASTYTWTGGAINGVAFAPSSTTGYTVSGTSTAGCTSTNVAAITVTVNALPTVTANATNTFICRNASVAVSGSGASTYTWTGGVTNAVAFTPTSTVSYSVTGTNTAGCTNTNVAAVTVTVNALPTVTANATNTFICRNGTVAVSGSGASTYTWTGGVSDGIAFSPTATANYTVSGTSTAGCTSTNVAAITVTVNALPTVTANTTASVICENATITLSGSGASTYTWSGGASNGLPFAPSSTTSYTVSGTSTAGCTSTNVAAITITVNALPTVTANATNTFICRNATVAVSGSGASTYTWTGGVTNGTAFTPTTTVSYSVTGTNTAGCTSTNVAAVTVIVNALPTVTANATNTFICINDAVAVNGSGANTYTWTGGVTNGTAFSPTATANYTVSGTSTAGCTSTNVAVVTITVNALPTVTANTTASVICENASITLSGSGASTYTWTGGAIDGVPFSPVASAIFSVSGTNTAGCTSTNVATRSITVNLLPIVNASATNTFVCENTAVIVAGGGATTYTWTGGVTNGTSFTPTTTASYSVTGTSPAGCTSTNVAAVTITVNALPTLTANATNTFICRNNTVALTGSGANTYTWTGGITDGVTFSPTATAIYFVSGTSTAGCTNTNVAAVTVTVNALPTVTANTTASVICLNYTVTLTGSGASTYTWTGGVTDGVAFSPTSTTSYTVVGTNTAGCTSTNVAVRTITVNALPTVTANASTTLICQSTTVTLNGAGAVTYTWSGGITNATPFSPLTSTTYTLLGSNLAGCTNSNLATITISVNSLPSVTANVTNTLVCINNTVILSGSGASTYTWTGGAIDGTPFSPIVTNNYSVVGTSSAGCTSTNPAFIPVYVSQLPVVTAFATQTLICMNGSVTLLASGAGASGTYTWSGGAVNGQAFSPSVTSSYSLTGTNLAGCISTNVAVQTISVNPAPILNTSAANTVICNGYNATLTASGADSYIWNPGGIGGSGLSPTPSVTTIYTVTGTYSLTGCSNTAAISINVNPNPTIMLSVSGSTLCSGTTVAIVPSGANSYTLNPGGISGNSFTVSPSVSTTYSITGTNGFNCVNAIPATTSVTPTQLTNIRGVVSSTLQVSLPGFVTLYKRKPTLGQWQAVSTVSINGSWPAVNYDFVSVPSGTYAVRATPNQSTMPYTYGLNAVGWQSSIPILHDCLSNTNQDIDVDQMYVSGTGQAALSGKIIEGLGYSSPTSTTIGNPISGVVVKVGSTLLGRIVRQTMTNAAGEYTLSKLPLSQPFDSYFILVDIPGLDTNGTYRKRVITASLSEHYKDLDFIVDSARINPSNVGVGINEIDIAGGHLQIYPNPTRSQLNIEFKLNRSNQVSIEMIDLTGRTIKTLLPLSGQSAGELQVVSKLDELTPGIYFVRIKVGTEERTSKIVITD